MRWWVILLLGCEQSRVALDPDEREAGSIVASPPADCTDLGGGRYAICSGLRTWAGARLACQGWGGDLAIFESTAESAEVAALANAFEQAWYWIGLEDAADEGTFVWIDATPLGASAWHGVEPNDRWGSEDCVYLYSHTGTWNDFGCDRPLAGLCELQ